MENKLTSNYIKELMVINGKNEYALGQLLGLRESTLDLKLEGNLEFDLAELEKVSLLFNVSLDSLLKGGYNTKKNIMTESERLTRLGINAVTGASETELKKKDVKGKSVIDYSITLYNLEIIKYFFKNKLFELSEYQNSLSLIKILLENKEIKSLVSLLSSNDTSNLEKDVLLYKDLWIAPEEKLLSVLYLKKGNFSRPFKKRIYINIKQAIIYNNIDILDSYLGGVKVLSKVELKEYLECASKHSNYSFIKKAYKRYKNLKYFNNLSLDIDIESIKYSNKDTYIVLTKLKKKGAVDFIETSHANNNNNYESNGTSENTTKNRVYKKSYVTEAKDFVKSIDYGYYGSKAKTSIIGAKNKIVNNIHRK